MHASLRPGSLRPLILAASFAAGAAHSQVAAQAPLDSLDEVVVTARKRVETVQSIPESIQAFGAVEIADAHITRIDDLGNFVSNLNITTRADNTPDVVMRGVGSYGVVSGVGFYANDVQLFDGETVRNEDLERIEVLKGPQGTLYGGSNIGGAIKYVTRLPTDEFHADAAVEFGNYSTQTYSAVVSGPLGAGVDARATFFDTHTDGYIYDTTLQRTVDDGSERGGRLTLKYASDATTAILYLNGDWQYGGVGDNLYYRPASPSDYSLNVADGTLPTYERGLYSITLHVDHQLNDRLTLTSISSYFHSYADVTVDVDKGPLPFLTAYQNFERDVASQEFRLAETSGPIKWLVGAFAQGNDPSVFTNTRSFNGDPSNPASLADPGMYSDQLTDPKQQHREYALFGDGSYDWRDWTFEAGLRVDYNNSSMADELYGIYGDQHGTEMLPKVSASYHVDKDIMAYTTISRGFQPGDLVEQFDAAGNPYISKYYPETTWNYEMGVKSMLSDRVRLNAAVFYINYQDRLYQTVAYEAAQFIQVTQNIGPSKNYGGEFDVATRIVKELMFTASFGVTKAIWGNVPYYDPDLNMPTNLDGRTAPNTPAYQGSLSLDWTHHLTEGLVFGARADAAFIGQQWWDPTDHYQQTAYQLVNFGVRLEANSRWTLAAHVSNAFDKRYNTAYISAAEVQAPFNVAGIGRPRLWSVSLAYHW
jgi:iron complex outermembrane recepter protein